MEFPEKLLMLRKKHGLSQKKLADALDVAQSSVNYWEKGQRVPSIEMVGRIAEYFKVSLDSLLWESEIKEQTPINMIFGSYYSKKDGVADIHFSTDNFTLEELNEIQRYAEFIKTKRQ